MEGWNQRRGGLGQGNEGMENKGERGVGKGIAGLKQQLKGGTEVGNEDL